MNAIEIPSGEFSAYLFDCDGTLVNSMLLHRKSWDAALAEFGGHFPEKLFYDWAGMPSDATVRRLNELFGLKMPVFEVVRRKENLYLELIPSVELIPEVVAHVKSAHGRIPLAVVSGAPGAALLKTLGATGLTKYFDAVIGAEDYAKGKPDPEPFLVAASRLGVKPGECLVFEDAELGIQSAVAAGMRWVRVPARRALGRVK